MLTPRPRNVIRKRVHTRIREKLSGTAERPRLNVYRSLNHIYTQLIDDQNGVTLAAASSMRKKGEERAGAEPQRPEGQDAETRSENNPNGEDRHGKSRGATTGGNVAAASAVGTLIAERAREKGITRVVFDRGGYLYHGRVKALADAARAAGLEF